MILAVLVRQRGEVRRCALGGFGMVLCGFCGEPLRDQRVGCRCDCGATVTEIEFTDAAKKKDQAAAA